jgi:hypothetical protein
VHEFKQEHAPLVDEKIRKETTLTGTPEELVKRVKAMRRLGVKQIAVHGGTRAGAPKVITDFAKYVIGGCRGSRLVENLGQPDGNIIKVYAAAAEREATCLAPAAIV